MTLDTVKMNRFTLAFDDAGLEREFLDEYADSVRMQIRYVWSVATILVLVATAADPPNRLGAISSLLRFAMFGPAIVLGGGGTFLPRAAFHRFGSLANGIATCLVLAYSPAALTLVDRTLPLWARDSDPVAILSFIVSSQVLVVFAALLVSAMRCLHASATSAVSVLACLWSLLPHREHTEFVADAAVDLVGALSLGVLAAYLLESFRRRLFLERRRLTQERAKSEALLRNVLPTAIADRLKNNPSHIADGFTEVTILFADIVGFTDLSASLSPAEVVAMLNRLFTAFDDLAEKHGLEKIKTIGDAYMVVGGLPEARPNHAEAVVAMALGMRDAVADVSKATGYDLKVRIGANSGPVIAGVIGKKKFAYDLWGDAVNTASRMESHGQPGEIRITASTQERVKEAFELESRGTITVKGKGELPTWFVRGVKAAPTASAA